MTNQELADKLEIIYGELDGLMSDLEEVAKNEDLPNLASIAETIGRCSSDIEQFKMSLLHKEQTD
jgi:hypothetical protein